MRGGAQEQGDLKEIEERTDQLVKQSVFTRKKNSTTS